MLGFTLHQPTLGLLRNNGSGYTIPANLGVSFYASPAGIFGRTR